MKKLQGLLILLTGIALGGVGMMYYDKKIFKRSRIDIYEYSSDFCLTEVEEMCLNELKKNQWNLLKTRKINDEKRTYILQKMICMLY